jgi:hypothetical protein
VKFHARSGSGQRLVEFEDAVIGVEVVPDEKRAHTLPFGTFASNVV